MAHNFRTKEETARHNRRLRRQLLGAVLTVLMVVGLVTVVSAGVQGVAALFDDTEEKEEFAARLNTLVMLDPVPFGTLDQADPQVLKTAAVWARAGDLFFYIVACFGGRCKGVPTIYPQGLEL